MSDSVVRNCEVYIDGELHQCRFHQFGTKAIYGEGNNPVSISVAIVESKKDKKVHMVEPDKVKFVPTKVGAI